MAQSGELSERWQTGVQQQHCGAEHQAFCDLPENFQFAKTPGCATSNAVIFSLIETAKANGIDPYTYLTHSFKTAPCTDRYTQGWALQLLSENVPAECYAPANNT